jgi:hypothetical protein
MEKDTRPFTMKKCPRCGKEFACYGDNDCWCESVGFTGRKLPKFFRITLTAFALNV